MAGSLSNVFGKKQKASCKSSGVWPLRADFDEPWPDPFPAALRSIGCSVQVLEEKPVTLRVALRNRKLK